MFRSSDYCRQGRIVIAVIALLLIVAAIVRHKNATHKSALTTKQLVYSAVAIALAVVCSMIKLFDMPMGGSVTLLSMLFIVLIAYWYGPYVGILTAVAYGLVRSCWSRFSTQSADALGLPAGIWCSGSACRFLSRKSKT